MKAICVTFTIRPYAWIRNTTIAIIAAIAIVVPQHMSVAADIKHPRVISPTQAYKIDHIRITKIELSDKATDLDAGEAHDVATTIVEESMLAGYDPLFVLAIIEAESNFRVEAVSKSGARGLMQLIPSTFRNVSDAPRMFNPVENVRAGIRYLAKLNGFKKIDTLLLAYNQGPGAAIQVKNGSDTPDEAQAYIPKVITKYKAILERYGRNPKMAHKLFRVSPNQYASILPSAYESGACKPVVSDCSTVASNP
jgi:hypothetical protein